MEAHVAGLVGLTMFASMFIRSAIGIGHGVVAMPLLTLLLPIKVATPLLAAVGTAITAIIMVTAWQKVDWRAATSLIVGGIVGIPIGIWGLVNLPTRLVMIAMTVVLAGFGLWSLLQKNPPHLATERWPIASGVGFLGGVLGGAYNLTGIPPAAYGALRRWSPAEFRVIISAYFLPTGIVTVFGHWVSGLWTEAFYAGVVWSIVPALVALEFGRRVNAKIPTAVFTRIIWILVVIMAIGIFVKWI